MSVTVTVTVTVTYIDTNCISIHSIYVILSHKIQK
jgi:hypothetical protein